MSILGTNIRKLRDSKGFTQAHLGEKIGVAESTVSLYESGKREPDIATIKRIADIFNVTTDSLLGRSIAHSQDPNDAAKLTIREAISDDPELLEFWSELEQREDLKIFFKQVKSLSPSTIKRVMRYIKMVEDEEANED